MAASSEARAGAEIAAGGDLRGACVRYERAIELQPDSAHLHFKLGCLQWRLGLVQAGNSLKHAMDLQPDYAMAHAAHAQWSLQQGLVESADRESRTAMQLLPDDHNVMLTRAAVLETIGELDEAWNLVSVLVQRRFTPVPVIRLYGRMACFRGEQLAAIALVQERLKQWDLLAWDRARLHFTFAELLESLHRYDEAFSHARHGNMLVAPAYDQKSQERTFDLLIEYFTPSRMRLLPRGTDRSEKPVFVVGMPRSGTSLVEQILASHSAVHGAGELDLMSHVWAGTVRMLSANAAQYPACLDRLTIEQADGLAQLYLEPLTAMNPAAARITDKLPLNFLHLGLIALLMPGARVIDCRRDRRDTCLSCFFALFEGGNEFKFDLNNTAHFYDQHRRLMEHWKRSLELPILEVWYEDLVADPENQARRMLEFVGLPWEEQCLRFHQSKRPVRTSSLQQVRRPLYNSSIGKWRHYERYLSDLGN